jgi:hypothetical protein
MFTTESLTETLGRNVHEGELWGPLEGSRIRCLACSHRCPIPAGFAGVCKVRFNRGGKLYVPSAMWRDGSANRSRRSPSSTCCQAHGP